MPILVAVATPVVIYMLVFTCTLRQAIVIWVSVVIVVGLAGAVLVLAAMSLGSWLDVKFDLPMM